MLIVPSAFQSAQISSRALARAVRGNGFNALIQIELALHTATEAMTVLETGDLVSLVRLQICDPDRVAKTAVAVAGTIRGIDNP